VPPDDLYLAATLEWADRGLSARVEADLLTSDKAVLHLTAAAPVDLAVRLRRPGWARTAHVELADPAVTLLE